MAHRRIVELMQVSEPERDLAWLQESLQNAVQLELSTLPPYLTAYWSVKGGEVKGLLLGIILQEMYHMGLAANMLVAVGGTPVINSDVPSYPGPLPGGVRPELTVTIESLSKDWLNDVAMQIEYPEDGPIVAAALSADETYTTIGAFYDAIEEAFVQVNPSFDTSKQLALDVGGNEVTVISSLADAEAAIQEIKEQGEGTKTSPEDAENELAHYYIFSEIYEGNELVLNGSTWSYTGPAIPFPETYEVASVSSTTGYPDAPDSVQTTIAEFQRVYSLLLDNLQAAWINGDATSLTNAIINMGALQEPVITLMQTPISGGTGNYGPVWKYVSS